MKVMILGSGYIGSAFKKECHRRNYRVFTATQSEYRRRSEFNRILSVFTPHLVVNAAAYIPHTSVADCDKNPAETIRSNTMLPAMLAEICHNHLSCLAQISTGCLWSDGLEHAEDDLPQRAFNGHCGLYVGTKYMAEELVAANCERHYIWRVRLPFDEFDHPRNYLSKLAALKEVWDHENTICHRGDFVKGCLDLWENSAQWGTYHVANPGSITAKSIWFKMRDAGIPMAHCSFVPGPQGGSILSVKKMEAAGVKLRPVEEAIQHAIKNWRAS